MAYLFVFYSFIMVLGGQRNLRRLNFGYL